MSMMEVSDTYLAILDEGRMKYARKAVTIVGNERFGMVPDGVKDCLEGITDLERLDRMIRRAVVAANWHEIFETL